MPIKQLTLHCTTCNEVLPHNIDKANHLAHGLLTLFTAGLYLPIWIIVAIGDNAPAVCVKCGGKRAGKPEVGKVEDVSVMTKAVIFGVCAVLLAAAFVYGTYIDG